MAVVLCGKLTRLHWVCNQQQLTCHRGCKRNLLPSSQSPLIFFTALKATVPMSCTDTQSSLLSSNRAWDVCRALSPKPKSKTSSVPTLTLGSVEDSSELLVSHRNLLCVLHVWPLCQPDQLEGECLYSLLYCSQQQWGAGCLNSPQTPQGGSQHSHCLLPQPGISLTFPHDGKTTWKHLEHLHLSVHPGTY